MHRDIKVIFHRPVYLHEIWCSCTFPPLSFFFFCPNIETARKYSYRSWGPYQTRWLWFCKGARQQWTLFFKYWDSPVLISWNTCKERRVCNHLSFHLFCCQVRTYRKAQWNSRISIWHRYTIAVDWWAFACLTYELLHGKTPFAGQRDEVSLLISSAVCPVTKSSVHIFFHNYYLLWYRFLLICNTLASPCCLSSCHEGKGQF